MNWLKQRREEIGILSQEELAAKLQLQGVNVVRATVSAWENDRNKPPLKDPAFRVALAAVLRLSEPELLRKAGFGIEIAHTEAGERGANIIDGLPPDQQRLALRLLEQFIVREAGE